MQEPKSEVDTAGGVQTTMLGVVRPTTTTTTMWCVSPPLLLQSSCHQAHRLLWFTMQCVGPGSQAQSLLSQHVGVSSLVACLQVCPGGTGTFNNNSELLPPLTFYPVTMWLISDSLAIGLARESRVSVLHPLAVGSMCGTDALRQQTRDFARVVQSETFHASI